MFGQMRQVLNSTHGSSKKSNNKFWAQYSFSNSRWTCQPFSKTANVANVVIDNGPVGSAPPLHGGTKCQPTIRSTSDPPKTAVGQEMSAQWLGKACSEWSTIWVNEKTITIFLQGVRRWSRKHQQCAPLPKWFCSIVLSYCREKCKAPCLTSLGPMLTSKRIIDACSCMVADSQQAKYGKSK